MWKMTLGIVRNIVRGSRVAKGFFSFKITNVWKVCEISLKKFRRLTTEFIFLSSI